MPVVEALAQEPRANEEAVDLEQLGVFGPNKSAPVHRWVSFTEGFSAQLVARELTSYDSGAFIFDPFGGTGTTPLVAVQLGHAAAWSEVNPYLREAATTKIASARAARPVRIATATALREALLLGPGEDEPLNPLTRADADIGTLRLQLEHLALLDHHEPPRSGNGIEESRADHLSDREVVVRKRESGRTMRVSQPRRCCSAGRRVCPPWRKRREAWPPSAGLVRSEFFERRA